MKKLTTILLSLAILAGIIFKTSNQTQAAATTQLLSGILQKMDNAHRGLKSMRAKIVQQKTNTQIGSTDTSYGNLVYVPGPKGKVKAKIEYTKPSSDVLSIAGDNVTYYQPRINQALKTVSSKLSRDRSKGSSVGLLMAMMGSGNLPAELRSKYNMEIAGEELINGRPATKLHLIPREAGQIAVADIWVSNESYLPVQLRFQERNGDLTFFKFSNMELNARVTDDEFKVKLQPGTAVVDKL
jgi:outer membrane lipoprotein-sorting protein